MTDRVPPPPEHVVPADLVAADLVGRARRALVLAAVPLVVDLLVVLVRVARLRRVTRAVRARHDAVDRPS